MIRRVFDIETNGFLDELDKIHCISVMTLDGFDKGKVYRFRCNGRQDNIEDGLAFLDEADVIIGHNIIKFDIPAIQKVFPDWTPRAKAYDTLVVSRLIWTDLKDRDMKMILKGKIPRKMYGHHSLEAWGYRLGNYKGDFKGPWEKWTQEMDDYCEQDVHVTADLYKLESLKNYSSTAIQLEHDVAEIVGRQERNGFHFNVEKAGKLYAQLVEEQHQLEEAIKEAFPITIKRGKSWTPKRNNKAQGYVAGIPMCKVDFPPLNPSSRDQVADALIHLRGWKPTQFTPAGKPELAESTVKNLNFPEAELIARYMMLDKRIGQLAAGNQAWLKKEKHGKIHGTVTTNGAVTGRMTHSNPNVAQVPAVGHPYGAECRELFEPRPGWKLVGCDASGLEVRMLCHYMAKYDGGAYMDVVLNGDIHQHNCDILNKRVKIDRYATKTFFYAFLYGAGDTKLGAMVGKGAKMGKILRNTFLAGLPALNQLIRGVKLGARKGFLFGLDKRRLTVRSEHSALNTLLQGAGAIIMKKALAICDQRIQKAGYLPTVDYEFVANVHDEWQIETKLEYAEALGDFSREAIIEAGKYFNLRIPLDAEYKIGDNWRETH